MKKEKGGKKCIILDLDECLIHTLHEEESPKDVISSISKDPELRSQLFKFNITDLFEKRGKGRRDTFWGFRRPHLREFLVFCFDYFDYVLVWSAGEYRYVHSVVGAIFGDIGRSPHLIYTRDDVIYISDGNYHKPISKILSDELIVDMVSIDKAFFLDDRKKNFITAPKNGIVIPAYRPVTNSRHSIVDDIALVQLMQWLKKPEIKSAPSILKLDKTKIFKLKVDKTKKYTDDEIVEILSDEKVNRDDVISLLTNSKRYVRSR